MSRVETSIDIQAPPGDIWALMCDPNQYPELADPTDRMVSVPETEFGAGYVYKEYGGIPPFKGESEWTVTTYEPMTHQVHVGDDGQMSINLDIRLDPIEGGTRLTQSIDLTPRWYLVPVNALMWPLMMRKRAQEAMDKSVANVKRMVED